MSAKIMKLGSVSLSLCDGHQTIEVPALYNKVNIQLGELIQPEQLLDAARAVSSNGVKLASESQQHKLLQDAGKLMEKMPAFTSNDNISPAFLKVTIAETLAQIIGLTFYSANVLAKPSELAIVGQPAKSYGEINGYVYSADLDDYDEDDEEWDDDDYDEDEDEDWA